MLTLNISKKFLFCVVLTTEDWELLQMSELLLAMLKFCWRFAELAFHGNPVGLIKKKIVLNCVDMSLSHLLSKAFLSLLL